nr:MAG TPA: hypothetical protein [Caudoviricetes sp.]
MQFLDAIGLAYFWEKIKSWVGKNYLSLKGGNIEGSIQIDNDEGIGLRIIDGTSYSNKSLTISPTRITMSYIDDDSEGGHPEINDLDIQKGLITAMSFTKIGGTSAQALIADGSVKGIGSANGIAGLDANGNVPLANLGNLDTTVAEVVTALPTSNIKRHIYLVKDSDTTNNKYAEYVYTGDISAAYDSTKWEKLGDFRADVDLKDYSKKNETINGLTWRSRGSSLVLLATLADGNQRSEFIPTASSSTAGAMSNTDKAKLDGIAANANNYSLPLAANGTRGGIQIGYAANGRNYPVQLSGEKAYVNVPWTDTNTTYGLATSTNDGLMKASDKAKIDSMDTTYAKKNETVDLSKIAVTENVLTVTPQGQILSQSINFINFNSSKAISIVLKDATSNMAGFMSIRDKNKLDNIADGATADSAITTAEIDALFT